MLPSWYVPVCVIVALALVVLMDRVLRNERRSDQRFKREVFDKGMVVTYPPMTNQEWEELEERLTRQREFDRIKDVVEEARREDFAG